MEKITNILVTGANGFIGKNLVAHLKEKKQFCVMCFDKDDSTEYLYECLNKAQFIFHLAGVNRPKDASEFYKGNADLTSQITEYLKTNELKTPILLTSSTQAINDSDYGKSKHLAEDTIKAYQRDTNARIFLFRLQNVFGKWCRPNYNSVVATFCHNYAHDLPIQLSENNNPIEFIYIDDVINTFFLALNDELPTQEYYHVYPSYHRTLKDIVKLLDSYKMMPKNLHVPNVGDAFSKKLYSTYLTYLPVDKWHYYLTQHVDHRGAFIEFNKNDSYGQISVSTSKPGVTRGEHYHHTKTEKFLVLKGKAVMKFRNIYEKEVVSIYLDGATPQVVDILPGYTHNITNIGDEEMVLLLWANEGLDQNNPDTYYLKVEGE